MVRNWKIIIILLIILGGYLFFLISPLLLIGFPAPVYHICNHDTQTHFISVKILDENNISILQKNYSLNPGETIRYERQINWYLPIPTCFISWSTGVFTFNFVLDEHISKNITTEIWVYQTIDVFLYPKKYDESKPTPIEIKIATF